MLTVVWPQEWFRQHMFTNKLLGEGLATVYLFLMKPAVALMVDIFNRFLFHTEENNKQQTSSFCQCLLPLAHAHKTTVSALWPAKSTHNLQQHLSLYSPCALKLASLLGIHILYMVMQSNTMPLQWVLHVKLTMLSHSGESVFVSGIPWSSY